MAEEQREKLQDGASKSRPIRFIDAGRVPALRSQAIYHALAYAKHPETPDTIVLCEPTQPYVCTGFFQPPAREVNLERCAELGIPVIRRETGGGTVLIDEGQMFVQWIFHPANLPARTDERFVLFCESLIRTYRTFGIKATFHAPNDVQVRGRKIVGTGAAAIGEAQVVTGNFIFEFDFGRMADLLKVPDQRFRQLYLEGMKRYMSSFRQELGHLPERAEVKKRYIEQVAELLGRPLQRAAFGESEKQKIAELEQRLADPEWVFEGTQPQAAAEKTDERIVKIQADVFLAFSRFGPASKPLNLYLQMKKGRIDRLHIEGETGMTETRCRAFENFLRQVELKEEVLLELISDYFALHEVQTCMSPAQWAEAIMKLKKMKK